MITRYRGDRIPVRKGSRRVATPLLAALVLVASFDVVFAVDSIPAIFAITRDTFGMTSLFFSLVGALGRFRYLNLGLAGILTFVGVKMLASDVAHVSPVVSLAIIAATLGISMLASRLVGSVRTGAHLKPERAPKPQAAESPTTRPKRSTSAEKKSLRVTTAVTRPSVAIGTISTR